MPEPFQTTISAGADCGEGIGLHSGQRIHLFCRPAPANHGIVFKRVDLDGQPEVPAQIEFLDQSALNRQTSLVLGAAVVGTVEHLLACCAGLGIDNLLVEIDGPEVPMHDGSALFLAERLREAGLQELEAPRRFLRISHPIIFQQEEATITAFPSENLDLTFFADFEHPAIGNQACNLVIDAETFLRELAPARTFCTLEDVEALRRAGLIRGGSLECAVVFGPDGPMDTTLRFENEPARHKLLDLLGDLSLLGRPLKGMIQASRSGHRLHAAFVRKIKKELESDEQPRD